MFSAMASEYPFFLKNKKRCLAWVRWVSEKTGFQPPHGVHVSVITYFTHGMV